MSRMNELTVISLLINNIIKFSIDLILTTIVELMKIFILYNL